MTKPNTNKNILDTLTLRQAQELVDLFPKLLGAREQTAVEFIAGPDAHPFQIGKAYLIRTVTMIDTGVVKAVYPHEIVLTDAAWIADTGRFSDAVKKAEFSEVEPFPDGEIIIGRGSIIDAVQITKIQRSQK